MAFESWESVYAGVFIVEVETYTEGGENGFVHKLPGRMTWPNLVLKRGVTAQDVLMNWLQDAVGDGSRFVKDVGGAASALHDVLRQGQLHFHGRQGLTNFVVQFAGDALALYVLQS